MALVYTIMPDIKEAMKARQMEAVTALRGLHAQIKDATINAGKPLTDEAVIACVNKAIKQREDSIEQYTAGNRDDLVAKERAELELIRKYQRTRKASIVKEGIGASAYDLIWDPLTYQCFNGIYKLGFIFRHNGNCRHPACFYRRNT